MLTILHSHGLTPISKVTRHISLGPRERYLINPGIEICEFFFIECVLHPPTRSNRHRC